MVKFEDTQNFQFLCIEAKILALRDLLGRLKNLKITPPPKKSHVFDVGIKRGAEDLQPLSPCVYWNQVRQNFFKSNLKQLENSGFIGVADGIDILIYSVSQASPAQMTVCSNAPSYREMMMMTHFLS